MQDHTTGRIFIVANELNHPKGSTELLLRQPILQRPVVPSSLRPFAAVARRKQWNYYVTLFHK